MRSNIFNIAERAFWTGVQSGLAILSADGFGWLNTTPLFVLATAGLASVLSMIKTFSLERLRVLGDG